ncbi:replication endonuclease [Enterobacteriaceae bacterium 89]|nr:replication endonuclease [Enterobacteriaceae bacterium 89]
MTPQTYAWPWNAPRQAIGSPGLTHQQSQQRSQSWADLTHAQQAIAALPTFLKQEIYRRSDWLETTKGPARASAYLIQASRQTLPRLQQINQRWSPPRLQRKTSQQVFNGHFDTQLLQFLASRLVNMLARYHRLPEMNRTDVNLLADDIARFIRAELADIDIEQCNDLQTLRRWYRHAGVICQQFNVTPPHWSRFHDKGVDKTLLAPAVIRMFNETWWRGRLHRVARQWREHLYIALGCVSKRAQAFASKNCLREWRDQKRRTREFLKGMELEDEEGNRISLIDKYDASNANPAIRRCELMTRIRGFETICQQLGYKGEFCTLTAPAKYHATRQSGAFNPRWSGASPAETQSWFNRLWAKIRAKLHRDNIRIFGLRVAEPHHDGTPHWHLLIFVRPEQQQALRQILSHYAWEEESEELTTDRAKQARFHSVEMEASKGSATGYLAKYIAKNIDGYALENERDRENGVLLKESAMAVCAWATRWHIRQFQFIGGAPVTVYRELRRLADRQGLANQSVEFVAASEAADNGDWAGYVNAQGGPLVKRDALQVRALYLPRAQFNRYGEETVSIRGVFNPRAGESSAIITRTRQWKIVPRRLEDDSTPPAASWSSVSNCTPPGIDFLTDDLSRPLNRRQRQKLTHWLRLTPSVHSRNAGGPR